MGSSADEARAEITEQRKSLIEFDFRWFFRLADWLFSYPPRPPLFKKQEENPPQKTQSSSPKDHSK